MRGAISHLAMRQAIVFVAFVICGCIAPQTEQSALTRENRIAIEGFADSLVLSINKYEYELLRNSWSDELFKQRIKGLSSAMSHVFEVYFDEKWTTTIKSDNMDLVNRVKYQNGRVYLSNILYSEDFAEITLLIVIDTHMDFWKYRIEMLGDKPVLSDYFLLKQGRWRSEVMEYELHVNQNYTASSVERRSANQVMEEHRSNLQKGDTLLALLNLYELPKTHAQIDGLSLEKISLAMALNDTIYEQVLSEEYSNSNNLYINYLFHLYWRDSLGMDSVIASLREEIGNTPYLDSLSGGQMIWY